MRNFLRFHLLKVLIALVIIQLGVFAWLEKRNLRPEALPDSAEVFSRHAIEINALRNDADPDSEDTLFIAEVKKPLHGEIKQMDDNLLYEAPANFAGVDSFQYTISDGRKNSKKAYIKIDVKENKGPDVRNDEFRFYPSDKYILNPLANDSDREGDTIMIGSFSKPVSGTIEQHGNAMIYKPSKVVAFTDSFTYSATDGFTSSESATVVIKSMDESFPCYPWLAKDIGRFRMAGNLKCKHNELIIASAGFDTFNNTDKFYYLFQPVTGNFSIYTRLKSIEKTHNYAKAGIMFRESLDGNSKNVSILYAAIKKIVFQKRPETGESTIVEKRVNDLKTPIWMKLRRKGNQFIAYTSENGHDWIKVSEIHLILQKDAYIGLAVSSHNEKKHCTAIFDRENTNLIP